MKTKNEQLSLSNAKSVQKLEDRLQKSDSLNNQLSKEKLSIQSLLAAKEKEFNELIHKNTALQANV
jgi:hypothetical protein